MHHRMDSLITSKKKRTEDRWRAFFLPGFSLKGVSLCDVPLAQPSELVLSLFLVLLDLAPRPPATATSSLSLTGHTGCETVAVSLTIGEENNLSITCNLTAAQNVENMIPQSVVLCQHSTALYQE